MSQRIEYVNFAGTFMTDPVWTYPTGFCCYNVAEGFSAYWDKRAMSLYPGDYTKADVTHWLRNLNFNQSSEPKVAHKRPLENRVWYEYPGETHSGYSFVGTLSSPSKV